MEESGTLLATSGPYVDRAFTVGPEGGLIGRSRKCRVSLLHDCEVSHNHAVIEPYQGTMCIRDVGSTFGTYLNDKRLSEPKRASEPHKLKSYDSIKVGQTSLRWRPHSVIRRAIGNTIPTPFPLSKEDIVKLGLELHLSLEGSRAPHHFDPDSRPSEVVAEVARRHSMEPSRNLHLVEARLQLSEALGQTQRQVRAPPSCSPTRPPRALRLPSPSSLARLLGAVPP